MFDTLLDLSTVLPPLRRAKRPNVAAFVGALGGPFVLWIYLGSFIDLVVSLIVFGTLHIFLGGVPAHLQWGVNAVAWGSWGLWGYLRVVASNRRLLELQAESATAASGGNAPTPLLATPPTGVAAPGTASGQAWWASTGTARPPTTNQSGATVSASDPVGSWWTQQSAPPGAAEARAADDGSSAWWTDKGQTP